MKRSSTRSRKQKELTKEQKEGKVEKRLMRSSTRRGSTRRSSTKTSSTKEKTQRRGSTTKSKRTTKRSYLAQIDDLGSDGKEG